MIEIFYKFFFYKSNIVFVFVQIAFSRTNNLLRYTFYTTAISLKYFFRRKRFKGKICKYLKV